MKRCNDVTKSGAFVSSFEYGANTITKAVNLEIEDNGFVKKRRGFKTFGEMVDVLWSINKQNKKMHFTAEYTIILPLKGTKPVYKKTLEK